LNDHLNDKEINKAYKEFNEEFLKRRKSSMIDLKETFLRIDYEKNKFN
jgi:hypothetical protein